VDTVVFDKTGTITMNREVEIHFVGKDPGSEEQTLIRSVLRHSSHPLSTVLYAYLKDAPLIACEQYDEIPGMGITASLNGYRVNIGSALFVTGQAESEQTAASRVYVGIDGQSLGYYSIGNQYREGLEMLVRELRPRYALHLISGDNDAERERLQKIFGNDAQLHFNQTPTGKRDYIQDLMQSGHKVLMIGDGLRRACASSDRVSSSRSSTISLACHSLSAPCFHP
jgi:Cu+-exporting ATPase